MRPSRSGRIGGRTATLGCRRQSRTLKPALQGAFGGKGFLGMLATQENPDQAGAPGGMLAAKSQHFRLEIPHGERRCLGVTGVRRSDSVLTTNPKAAQQMPHGTGNQAEGRRDGRNAVPLFGPLSDDLTQWQRDRVWHEQSSLQEEFNHQTHDHRSLDTTRCPSCRKTAKPAVAFARQN
jgi:hypothetical protein